MSVRVTVVIPAYRRGEAVRAAVLSVFGQDLPKDEYELIVVDSSPDESNARMLEELRAAAPCGMRWIHKKPEGPGPSRNAGARAARAPVIAFMDSDCMAAPHWLRCGLATFDEGVGIVQGRTMPDLSQPLGVFRHYVKIERETHLYETANIFYRKDAFEQAGGFPADLHPDSAKPMGGEDVLVAWTVKRNGWRTRFCPDALMYHEVTDLPVWNWVFIKHSFIWPALLRRVPELRGYMFQRYFLDRAQALLVLGLAASAAGPLTHGAALLSWLPYILFRALEPTATLHGPLRVLRPGPYLLRDLSSFCLLAAGSIRYGSLLL